jgi:hypothetical protein
VSGPRQVRRIAHKAARLLAREGYGTRSARRRRRGDTDAAYFCPSCLKVAYRRAEAAHAMRDAMAVDDPRADQLNVYTCPHGQHFHVGHSLRIAEARP